MAVKLSIDSTSKTLFYIKQTDTFIYQLPNGKLATLDIINHKATTHIVFVSQTSPLTSVANS